MQAASAKIESFNPQNLKALRAEMDEALKSVAAKYGVAIRTGNARYTAENTTFKIDISTVSNGVVIDKSAADFTRYCGGYGLKPEHLGAAITFNGERYTIKGLASGRSHKYPFIATRMRDGKDFKLPESAVASLSSFQKPKPFGGDFIVVTPEMNKVIRAEIAKMQSDNPEAYYADGEHRANGFTEKQIFQMHYDRIKRQLYGNEKPLFGSVDVPVV